MKLYMACFFVSNPVYNNRSAIIAIYKSDLEGRNKTDGIEAKRPGICIKIGLTSQPVFLYTSIKVQHFYQ